MHEFLLLVKPVMTLFKMNEKHIFIWGKIRV
jgi:hypothetical protein